MDDALGNITLWYVIFPYMLPSFFGMLAIDTELAIGDVSFKFALAIFFTPFFLWILVLFSRTLPKRPSVSIKLLRVLGAAAFAVFFSLGGFGYIAIWNALTGSKEEILVSGPVVHLKAESGRWAGKLHNITIHSGGRDVMITVTPQEFSEIKAGDIYGRKMKLGGLGYYYTWGLAYWK